MSESLCIATSDTTGHVRLSSRPGVSNATNHQQDPAVVIQHLTQQLEEVRKLNRRLEILNSELVAEQANLRYRLVDEACDLLKRQRVGRWAARFVLPFARKARWMLRRKAGA